MKHSLLFFLLLIILGACGRKTPPDKTGDYASSLDDSITAVKVEIDSCRNNLDVLHDRVGTWLNDFTAVSNPREAGTYWIFTKFRDRYPLVNTGLAARINENGQFELIAALKGGDFDHIALNCAGELIESDVVPYDQALNYRANGLTTVMFTGPKAVEIARAAADNQLNHLALNFYQNNLILSWTIPNDIKEMMMATYMLYNAQQQAARLEQRIPMLNEKINLLRQHQDKMVPENKEKID